MTTTTLYVIRHGETPYNLEKRLQGQMDIQLNSNGLNQAKKAGVGMSNLIAATKETIKAIYSSDLLRAYTTAQSVQNALDISQDILKDSRLREIHFGELQGLLKSEIRVKYPGLLQKVFGKDADIHFTIPGGGESIHKKTQRCIEVFKSIAQDNVGESVVVVTHGGVINALHNFVTVLIPSSDDMKESPSHSSTTTATSMNLSLRAQNCSISKYECVLDPVSGYQKWSCVFYDDIRHLS